MHHPIVTENTQVCLYYGEELARYGFGQGHPFGPDRLDAFWQEVQRQGLDQAACICSPAVADELSIGRFHTAEYIARVKAQSVTGKGFLDYGDTRAAHAHAAERLCALADELCEGRVLAMGGGSYNRRNLAAAWTSVVSAFLEAS